MTKIRAKAYIPSASEYDKYFERFRAYMGAYVSKNAKKNSLGYDAAYQSSDEDYKGKGWFPLRSDSAGASNLIFCGTAEGCRSRNYSNSFHAGLRVALQLIYDENNDLVRGCRKDKRTCKVDDETPYGEIVVTSEATIVTFGKKEYIWLNEEECRNGKATTMELWSLDLVTTAEPFDIAGNINDYGSGTIKPLRDQCEKVAFEDCTKEELAMVAEVEMSSEDGYEKAVPKIKSKEQIEWQEKIEKDANAFLDMPTHLFADSKYVNKCLDVAKETIARETEGLEEITDEYVKNVEDQMKAFSEKIEKEKVKKEKAEKTEENRAKVLSILGKGKGEGK